jgi:hypothetical protein
MDLQLGPKFLQTIFSAEKAAHQEDRAASTMVVGLEILRRLNQGTALVGFRISGVRMILQRYRLTDCWGPLNGRRRKSAAQGTSR